MKTILPIFLCVLLLSGCGSSETLETLGPVEHVMGTLPPPSTVQLTLPDSSSLQTLGSDDQVYDCEGYILLRQTLFSGDFTATTQTLSGFRPDRLTVIETEENGVTRYDWVWTAAGEEGEVVGRAAVLDDGYYHYCLCAIASAESSTVLNKEWNDVFNSFSLEK
jgi:hypothetical protein